MTTISPTVPFSPVPKESDASVARFAEFRLAGLGRFAGLLGSRLPAAEAALLERGARLAAELDRPGGRTSRSTRTTRTGGAGCPRRWPRAGPPR